MTEVTAMLPRWDRGWGHFNGKLSSMAEPWKVTEATVHRIVLERGLDKKEVFLPSRPAARVLFMQFRAGELMDDDTLYFFSVVGK